MGPGSEHTGESRDDRISAEQLTKRAVVHVVAMPLYLGALGGIAYLGWKLALRFVVLTDPGGKLLTAAAILLLILLEGLLAHYVLRFIRWAMPYGRANAHRLSERDQPRR